MRLIDADALKKLWCEDCDNKHLCTESPACKEVQQLYAMPHYETFGWLALEKEPTRCKDCIKQPTCKFAQYQGNDGYCSLGERKTAD